MPGIAEVLTRKLGPLPVWAWGAIGLGGAYLLYRSGLLKSLSGSSSTPAASTPPATTTAPASAADAGSALQQELGLLQQLKQFQQGQTEQGAAPPTPLWRFGAPTGSTPYVWHVTELGQRYAQGYAAGAVHTSTEPPPNTPGVANTWAWSPVPTGNDPSGSPWTPESYARALTTAGMGGAGGIGGARGKRIPARQHALAGRPSLGATHAIWRGGHPMLGGPRAAAAGPADVTYPHYAMGGARNATQVAAHMGIHPARVLAVNGHMRAGQARPGQIIRVV